MIERLERLLNLVIALRETRRPMTADEIRSSVAGYGQPDHEAFRRMFERDKADLRALGVPVETVPIDRWDDRTGYRIDPSRYDLPPIELSPAEVTALGVAVAVTGLGAVAGPGLQRLAVAAGTSTNPQGAPPVEVDLAVPLLPTLLAAQASRTTVRFTYGAPGRPPSVRTVDPHAVVHRRGRWYLVGADHDRGERRSFRLDRVHGSVDTVSGPDAFPEPAEPVDVADVVPVPRAPIAVATLLVAPTRAFEVARRAQDPGEPQPDGWTRFTVPYAADDEVIALALELGPDGELVAPPELRAVVVARLRAAAGAA